MGNGASARSMMVRTRVAFRLPLAIGGWFTSRLRRAGGDQSDRIETLIELARRDRVDLLDHLDQGAERSRLVANAVRRLGRPSVVSLRSTPPPPACCAVPGRSSLVASSNGDRRSWRPVQPLPDSVGEVDRERSERAGGSVRTRTANAARRERNQPVANAVRRLQRNVTPAPGDRRRRAG